MITVSMGNMSINLSSSSSSTTKKNDDAGPRAKLYAARQKGKSTSAFSATFGASSGSALIPSTGRFFKLG